MAAHDVVDQVALATTLIGGCLSVSGCWAWAKANVAFPGDQESWKRKTRSEISHRAAARRWVARAWLLTLLGVPITAIGALAAYFGD